MSYYFPYFIYLIRHTSALEVRKKYVIKYPHLMKCGKLSRHRTALQNSHIFLRFFPHLVTDFFHFLFPHLESAVKSTHLDKISSKHTVAFSTTAGNTGLHVEGLFDRYRDDMADFDFFLTLKSRIDAWSRG